MKTDLSSHIKLDQVSKRLYSPESEVELASLTRYERIYTKVVETQAEGAADVAQDVANTIDQCVREKGRCVIGFGAGQCALSVYDELVKLYFADKVSFANVVAFNISELGLGVPEDDELSTMARLKRRLFNKVDIDPRNIHTFSAETTVENIHKMCKAYESLIEDHGGLDLLVCELTKTGSLAYNEPGSGMNTICRLQLLSGESRTRVAEAFKCDTAPLTAVTLGISNLLAARHIIGVAWDEDSAEAVFNTIEGRMTDAAPASFLQMHPNTKIVIDLEAASRLTRISYPWKVTSCEWTDKLIRRAIVWLCGLTGKPVLKLTNKDYNDHGLGELVAIYGSAYNVNIKIFNDLQHTITGWPGGKPNADDTYRPERATPHPKRVLVFSPLPDAVVVSMGGTLHRLVEQGHDVHVAFMTSGDVAVSDEDLLRNLLLSEKISMHYGFRSSEHDRVNKSVREQLDIKAVGGVDSADMRFIKGAIFTCEGLMACSHMGVARDHLHELSLPFYLDDPHGRGRVTHADAAIVARLIAEVRPHQIFVADDLTDPYGTHVRALNAVLMAIEQMRDEDFMSQCRVWMYRGQWGQWDIDHVEMAVPMSPEEFAFKRDAILRYQSQIKDAPFRDNVDGHLSWQRSIDRNRALADLYNRLGLAAYEAIEAFVQYKPSLDNKN
ncbi:MAG: glucosamine-6-phosphate deaminase [Muribaculaceae bacterium]|nr:glucosamine-6-phosphate deaminase [Muribaculaceae bacterium]MBR3100220.1 glucosamine-6-phosphate deaminase [Muribaculaceae bacterium]